MKSFKTLFGTATCVTQAVHGVKSVQNDIRVK